MSWTIKKQADLFSIRRPRGTVESKIHSFKDIQSMTFQNGFTFTFTLVILTNNHRWHCKLCFTLGIQSKTWFVAYRQHGSIRG